MKITFFDVSYALAYAELLANVQSVDTFHNGVRVLFLEPITPEQISDLKSWPDIDVKFAPDYNREVFFRDADNPKTSARRVGDNNVKEGAD